MTTRIAYNFQNGPGMRVADFVNEVQTALYKGRRIKAQLDSMQSGADWTSVAAELGGGISPTQAQNLWTIISNAMIQIDSGQIAELARLDQG